MQKVTSVIVLPQPDFQPRARQQLFHFPGARHRIILNGRSSLPVPVVDLLEADEMEDDQFPGFLCNLPLVQMGSLELLRSSTHAQAPFLNLTVPFRIPLISRTG
jgi:hypothetical protein